MFTYRRLDIPYDLIDPEIILSQIRGISNRGHGEIQKNLINKNFILWLDELGVYVRWAEYFYRRGGQDGYLHMDGYSIDHRAKINQIFFDKLSSMTWHTLNDETILQQGSKSVIGTSETRFTENQVTFLDEVVGTGIFLVNAGIPHSVTMRGESRLCVSMLIGDKKTRDIITCRELEQRINSSRQN